MNADQRHAEAFFKALCSRDYRFDGRFFAGVKTTGIYCRAICPAPKPQRKNVEFFTDIFSAEKAGYRPCRRCRPESAPNSPAWIGRSATVQRALKLLNENRTASLNEDQFANLLGVSARHLRRLFTQEIGKTPQQILAANRLSFSRKLVLETKLPITEIVATAGFNSIRRFNDAFKNYFKEAPRQMRKFKLNSNAPLTMTLPYRPPFDWQGLLNFYRNHEIFGVEQIGAHEYSRVFQFNDGNKVEFGAIRVTNEPKKSQLNLELSDINSQYLFEIVQNVRRIFDLDSDPLLICNAFAACKVLKNLNAKYPGVRIPQGWDPFETIVCGVLGQLVSTAQARKFVQQLIENYGTPIKNPLTGEKSFVFPTVDVLAASDLAKVKTTKARKNTIREVAKAIKENRLSTVIAQSPDMFRESLQKITGIGAWTADYVSLRALGDTDAFPASDLIIKRQLAAKPRMNLEQVRPWRAYAAFYLWRDYRENTQQ